MSKKDRINLELNPATKSIVRGYGLDPQKIEFWRESFTLTAKYKVGFLKSIQVSTDVGSNIDVNVVRLLCKRIAGKVN